MPTITEIPYDHKIVSLSVERDAKRSPGIHLSGITKDMLITAGINRNRTKAGPDEHQHLIFEQGFLWERLVKEYIEADSYKALEWDWFVKHGLEPIIEDSINSSGGTIVRPGEVVMDGIAMTPDALNLKLYHLEEWKSTAMHVKGFSIPQKRIEWLWQTAAYARYFHMTRAVIRVWFYGNFPPEIRSYVVEWSTQEIEDNWKAILDHWEFMQKRT